MKALVMTNVKELCIREVEKPQIKSDEVLVRVKACSICGSDIHGYDGSSGRRIPPVIMGHEAAGIIEDVGNGVQEWKKGDKVTFDSTLHCGNCWYCKTGKVNLCENRRVLGVSCEEYRMNGAMAEYIAIPQNILYRLPDNVSYEEAAVVEPLSVAFHAIRRSGAGLGNTAVVVGAGMVGLLIIQLLKRCGCSHIIAIDLEENRLNIAKEYGADKCLRSDKVTVMEEVKNLTQDRLADHVFEAVGITGTIQMACECARKGGNVILVGNVSKKVEIHLQSIVTRELNLICSCASAGEYNECLDLMANGCIDLKSFISVKADLAEGPLWFNRLYSSEKGLIKVVLCP